MLETVMERLRDHFTVSQVFGAPIERDGVTVIPVATISGGGGGGQHRDDSTDDAGGGFGGQARPTGVYEIRGGEVRWRPAIDVQRLAIAAAVVVSLYLVTHRRRPR
jgi:uncharacterized spore protein YtfJ